MLRRYALHPPWSGAVRSGADDWPFTHGPIHSHNRAGKTRRPATRRRLSPLRAAPHAPPPPPPRWEAGLDLLNVLLGQCNARPVVRLAAETVHGDARGQLRHWRPGSQPVTGRPIMAAALSRLLVAASRFLGGGWVVAGRRPACLSSSSSSRACAASIHVSAPHPADTDGRVYGRTAARPSGAPRLRLLRPSWSVCRASSWPVGSRFFRAAAGDTRSASRRAALRCADEAAGTPPCAAACCMRPALLHMASTGEHAARRR